MRGGLRCVIMGKEQRRLAAPGWLPCWGRSRVKRAAAVEGAKMTEIRGVFLPLHLTSRSNNH